VSSLRFQWFVDGTLIQTQGAVFDSAQINTTGSHKMELVVIDDDEAESRLAFSLDIPQDQVSGSEGMLGGNYFHAWSGLYHRSCRIALGQNGFDRT
jgi:hypothetical protein